MLMTFQLHFGLNIEYGGKYKVGCPPVEWGWKGVQFPSCPHNWGKQGGRSMSHVGKEPKFGVENVNGGQNICSIDTSVGNGKNFENKLSPLRVRFL